MIAAAIAPIAKMPATKFFMVSLPVSTHCTSAPLPKFVIHRGTSGTNFGSKGGTSAPIPKFATPRGTLSRELRNRKGTSNSMVWCGFEFEVPAKS